jgi:hypothetical protein
MMLALLLLALAAPQDGVRGWRGDGSGVFPKATPPAEWSEKKNVKWHVTVGEGVSSPVVWENRVLVLAEPGTLVCLDRATGKIAWKEDLTADLPPEVKEKLRPPGTIPDRARATPVTDGKSIFVTLCSGLAASVSIDGKRRWVRAIEPAKLQYGPSASPVLVGTTLLVDSTCLTALDAETGAPRWTAPEAETHYGTPAILTLGGKAFAVTPKGAVVRISDGAVVAKEIASGLGGDQAPTPVLRDGIAYFAYRHSTAVRLSLEGEKLRHEKVWEQDLPAEVTASPVLHDGMLFVMASGQP